MLTVTGTAEFVTDDVATILKVRVAIQPHVPHEHDLLQKVAEMGVLNMDRGQLILDANFIVPQRDLLSDLEQTPSSAPCDATSASDDSE